MAGTLIPDLERPIAPFAFGAGLGESKSIGVELIVGGEVEGERKCCASIQQYGKLKSCLRSLWILYMLIVMLSCFFVLSSEAVELEAHRRLVPAFSK